MKVRCPICKVTAAWKGNPFRPFCSERCKLIDLGNWAAEAYRIPEKEVEGKSRESQEPHGPDRIGQED